MKVKLRINEVMTEAGAGPMDLIREGMAQGTAYRIYHNRMKRIDMGTLEILCNVLSRRLDRPIGPGDLIYTESSAITAQ
jgi:DNA-binding Xre family transcriptional regulator